MSSTPTEARSISDAKRLVYIVDIDNTIFYTFNSEYKSARPIKERIARINHLFDEGHTIIYWTARGGTTGIDWTEFTLNQLAEAGCKYTELRMGKPSYDLWIDDKAISDEDFFRKVV